MLDKMFGVSPPHKGEAPDSKLADNREFRGVSKSNYKKDFEKALDKKLNNKKENPVEKNDQPRKDEDLRAVKKNDKKEVRSLGGTKKKVTEDNDKDKMISNLMASNESKVEIPVLTTEQPAEIKVNLSEDEDQESDTGVDTAVRAANLNSASELSTMLNFNLATVRPPDVTQQTQSFSGSATPGLKALPGIAGQNNELSINQQNPSGVDSVKEELASSDSLQIENQNQLEADSANSLLAKLKSQQQTQSLTDSKELDLEAQLSAAVGFTEDSSSKQNTEVLLEKMRTFVSGKNNESSKSQSFELNVLDRLQNEQPKTAQLQQASAMSSDGFSDDMSNHSNQQSSEELKDFKDLKPEVRSSNELHQASGQMHSEFKPHLGVSSTSQESSSAKLEGNREANVNEIMQQAQYLIKKGGGEVSVKMSPEGLGEVHLKVLLQDGKMNIELQTQNKDIKKLIEDSLSELKSGLSAHRISLEHIKVDSVNATNTENNMQFQSNLNHSGSEKNAREFWNDLQGSGNFMNNQSGKKSAYTNSTNQSKLSTLSTSGSGASTGLGSLSRTYGGTKGVTVNRVA